MAANADSAASDPAAPHPADAAPAAQADLATLMSGELTVEGRLVDASNATLFCRSTDETGEVECVYKPIAGERPLWDFPDGTLAGREVAAYAVSEATGWGLVPPTILRDGPFGTGMCQLWIDEDPEVTYVDIVRRSQRPAGWRESVEAFDDGGRPVSLVHSDDDDLRHTAVLDIVINNADRKGGHLLSRAGGGLRVVDHGVCFHIEPKLRTVLWGWAGEALRDDEIEVLVTLDRELGPGAHGDLRPTLEGLIAPREIDATRARVRRLLRAGVFPSQPGGWRSLPWPPL